MLSAMLESTYCGNSLKKGLGDYCHHSNQFLFVVTFRNVISHLGGMLICYSVPLTSIFYNYENIKS